MWLPNYICGIIFHEQSYICRNGENIRFFLPLAMDDYFMSIAILAGKLGKEVGKREVLQFMKVVSQTSQVNTDTCNDSACSPMLDHVL